MKTAVHKMKGTPWATVLLAIAALLGALTLYQVGESRMATAQAAIAVAQATAKTTSEPNTIDARLEEAKSVAEALKKNNLFVPPPPKTNPVAEVLGILGDEVLINGKWYKAGDSIGDAKILAVEPTKIRVSWNGQEQDFAPLGSGQAVAPGGGPPSGPPSPDRGRTAGTARERPNGAVRRGGPGRVRPSREEMAGLRERFRNASPEEQQKLREEMRARFRSPEGSRR